MTRVTFLDHSGFLVELEDVCLLFDWWKGTLPPFPESKPLYVFASHRHEDHFNPKIFSLNNEAQNVHFLLGGGIKLSARNLERWNISPETAEMSHILKGNQACVLPRAKIETLPSTDEGIAFLVTAGKQTIFHAGDLNWWHWEGEDKAWNRNMEVNFKRYTDPLQGQKIDLAMLPLDPRLGEAGFWGPKYFLETAEIRHFLPMHQWGEFAFTQRFLEVYPTFAPQTIPVERTGQEFIL